MTDARLTSAGVLSPAPATVGLYVYLLNPNGIQYYVNANNDFRVSKFTDHLQHGNMDADVAYVFLEVQLAVQNLLIQACTCDMA